MAAYIPASYTGRDIDARPAAYGQQWSSDDYLAGEFFTDGRRKPLKDLRDLMATDRPGKPAMTADAIDAEIKRIKANRKQKDKERKERRKAGAAGGVAGGAPHMPPAQLKAERALKTELVRQTKEALDEAVQTGDKADINSKRVAWLAAKVELSKLVGVHAIGPSNSGKQKRAKVKLDDEQRKALNTIVQNHIQKLREILDSSNSHSEYSQRLHDEFVDFAQNKVNFYKMLPDSANKEKRVKLEESFLDKCEKQQVDDKVWAPGVFESFKEIMQKYRDDVEKIRSIEVYLPKTRKDKIKALRKQRTTDIAALLEANGISQKKQARAGRVPGRDAGG